MIEFIGGVIVGCLGTIAIAMGITFRTVTQEHRKERQRLARVAEEAQQRIRDEGTWIGTHHRNAPRWTNGASTKHRK